MTSRFRLVCRGPMPVYSSTMVVRWLQRRSASEAPLVVAAPLEPYQADLPGVVGPVPRQVPEDFALVSEREGLTVQLTPRGPGADLWVAEDGLERIVVRGARDVEFDYLVNGVRRGYADFQTIRQRATTPSNAAARGRTPERETAAALFARRLREGR